MVDKKKILVVLLLIVIGAIVYISEALIGVGLLDK